MSLARHFSMSIGISAELGDESTGFAVLMRANGFNLLDGDGTKRGFMAVALLVDLAILLAKRFRNRWFSQRMRTLLHPIAP